MPIPTDLQRIRLIVEEVPVRRQLTGLGLLATGIERRIRYT